MTSTAFLTYGNGSFVAAAEALAESARAVGFDPVMVRGPDDLDPVFRSKNAGILSQPRGAGYWMWKPQIILQTLDALEPGDVLVYSDAGRNAYYQLKRYPELLVAKARRFGFLLGPTIPQHGPLSRWTKRDAFVVTGMDRPDIAAMPPIQAGWSFWTNQPAARAFLASWIAACRDPRAITDMENELGENFPDFRDHRHDMSLMSLIAYRENAPHLDYTSTNIYRILSLRPGSGLAHYFLRRIDDAEAMERGHIARAFVQSQIDIRKHLRRKT
ncbi:MAG: hypothetical protein ABF313_18365 [Marivita sp.]|jgi:hypothetical protein